MPPLLDKRLLKDIKKIEKDPYPNAPYHFQEKDLTEACLVLSTSRFGHLHLRVENLDKYPTKAPAFRLNSGLVHPCVRMGHYLCEGVLSDDWTSAYDLETIAVVVLNVFESNWPEKGRDYRQGRSESQDSVSPAYICDKCNFGTPQYTNTPVPMNHLVWDIVLKGRSTTALVVPIDTTSRTPVMTPVGLGQKQPIEGLPAELVLQLMTCGLLSTKDNLTLARAWPKARLANNYFDIIRCQETKCFFTKEDFNEALLGVGIEVSGKTYGSDFDLVSHEAFHEQGATNSASSNTRSYSHWLPIPINARHWDKVKGTLELSLESLAVEAELGEFKG